MRKEDGKIFFFSLAALCNTLIQFLIGLHAYDLTSQSEILWPFSYQKWLCRNPYLPVLKKNKTYLKNGNVEHANIYSTTKMSAMSQ